MKNLNSNNLLLTCFSLIFLSLVVITIFKLSIGNLLLVTLVLACPLSHIFMMKDHSQQQNSGSLKKKGGDYYVKHHP